LSNLDAKLRVEMRRELKELHRRLQTTMIYVTHDQVEALTLGQRIVVMNEGAIQQVGRPMELYDWPANRFVAGFIGTPGMNFVDGTLVSSSGSRQFRRGGLAVDLSARNLQGAPAGDNLPAVLGVRPEDVRIGGRTISDRERPGSTARGSVRLVESLGDATIVTVAIEERGLEEQGECELLVKTDARSELRTGDAISVTVDASRVHVFDPATGQNWVCPRSVESKSATD
jgi:ABC-type sugar transport system ATPase subunit